MQDSSEPRPAPAPSAVPPRRDRQHVGLVVVLRFELDRQAQALQLAVTLRVQARVLALEVRDHEVPAVAGVDGRRRSCPAAGRSAPDPRSCTAAEARRRAARSPAPARRRPPRRRATWNRTEGRHVQKVTAGSYERQPIGCAPAALRVDRCGNRYVDQAPGRGLVASDILPAFRAPDQSFHDPSRAVALARGRGVETMFLDGDVGIYDCAADVIHAVAGPAGNHVTLVRTGAGSTAPATAPNT